MSEASSDTESTSDWTLLDEDGDKAVGDHDDWENESIDESSSTGSSVEVLGAKEMNCQNNQSQNSPSPPAGAAMFILRVNSVVPEMSESDESDSDHSNEKKNPTKRSSLYIVEPARSLHDAGEKIDRTSTGPEHVEYDSNLGEDTNHSNDNIEDIDIAATEQLLQSFPVLVDAEIVEFDNQNLKSGEDVSIDDIETVSVKNGSILGEREISDSAVDDEDILPEKERRDPEVTDRSNMSVVESKVEMENETKAPCNEDTMDKSNQSSVGSSLEVNYSGSPIEHAVESKETITEDRPEALQVDCSQKIVTVWEVSGLMFVGIAILNTAILLYVTSIGTGGRTKLQMESKLSSCKLDLTNYAQEHSLFENKLLKKIVEYQDESMYPEDFAMDFHEEFNYVLLDAREARRRLKVVKIENEQHKNDINQLRLEMADLCSSVPQLRNAAVPSIALQWEMEPNKSMFELRVKVAHLESERNKLINELVSVKKHALPCLTRESTQTTAGHKQVDQLELEKMRHELLSCEHPSQNTHVHEMDKDYVNTEERDDLLLQLGTLQKELAIERAWSRNIYRLYTKKSDDYFRLLAGNVFQNNCTQAHNYKQMNEKLSHLLQLAPATFNPVTKENNPLIDDGSNEDENKATDETEQSRDIHIEKTWSGLIMDIFNETQNSVLKVNRQIKDAWKQVKNLTEDIWTKNKPKLHNLRQKFTNKLLKVTQCFRNKINRKFKNWWVNKGRKQRMSRSQKRQFTRDANQANVEQVLGGKPLVRKCKENFKQVVKHVGSINEQVFQEMTIDDIGIVLQKIQKFISTIGAKLLPDKSDSWLQCQHVWWTGIVSADQPELGPYCADKLKCWQLRQAEKGKPINCRKWKKAHWNYLKKPCKNPTNQRV